MPEKSIVHCSRQFAKQWFDREAPMYAHLATRDRSRSLRALQSGAGHFKIARNFRRAFDREKGLERLEPVLTALEPLRDVPITPAGLPSIIGGLSRQLGELYGGKNRLSAATKFLWLLRRDPVVLYDEQARNALHAPADDYGAYLNLWHTGFETWSAAIADACANLSMSTPPRLSPTDASELWFHKRVYDVYLWNLGLPAPSVKKTAGTI